MEISASKVKELREKTGLGMMLCKEALVKANGDMNLAIEDLRKQGQVTAAKRADKAAKEGNVTIVMDDAAGILYEVNAETDFVAKNEDFTSFIGNLGRILLSHKPDDHATALQLTHASIDGLTVEAKVMALVGKIGENISFRRYRKVSVDPSKERLFSYVHGGGKIGVVVKIAASSPEALASPEVAELGKDLAMQVAAENPSAVDADGIPADVIAKEREIYAVQAKESGKGKTEEILARIVDGKLNKYYEEVTLVNQKFIKDPEITVQDRITAVAKALGADVKPVEFIQLRLGEAD